MGSLDKRVKVQIRARRWCSISVRNSAKLLLVAWTVYTFNKTFGHSQILPKTTSPSAHCMFPIIPTFAPLPGSFENSWRACHHLDFVGSPSFFFDIQLFYFLHSPGHVEFISALVDFWNEGGIMGRRYSFPLLLFLFIKKKEKYQGCFVY